MNMYLDFEEKIANLENQIKDLQEKKATLGVDLGTEISSLNKKYQKLLEDTYKNLTPWQKVLVARHTERPKALDYIHNIVKDFVPLAGDRLYAEDKAVISGIGRINNRSFVILGIEKGNDLESRIKHNFGMPKPEGYRKAQRLMKMADSLKLPIVAFVDTSGAYPGQEAEERGQGEAIAKSIAVGLEITTPLISVIIGEGGSGGAIALASGDCVIMLEHSVYSVISPEGCASILWRNDKMAQEAATSLCLTAQDLHKFGIVDRVIVEPVGGAHRNKEEVYKSVAQEIIRELDSLLNLDDKARKKKKRDRFLKIGKA
jgi:acetyl-CoA carboxylase carboxyl transferase subunit alpha